jgi:long-chain fatty acid transport protein
VRALGLVALALASETGAHASPLDLFGFGGRSPGMAGTGVALATDFDASWINPAGLADVPHKRVSFGYMYGDMALALDGEDTGTESVKGLVFGGALPIPLGGVMEDRVGLALGFHVPPDAVNRARAPLPGDPVFALLETRGHVVGIQIALGVKINDWLRVGAGVQTLATLDGRIHVFTDAAGRFATQSEQELVTSFAPLVGARALLREISTQVGLVFRGESRTDYQLRVTNDLLDSLPLTIPTLTIGGTSQFDPTTVAVELAYEWKPTLLLLGQLAWQRWSGYDLPTVNPVEGAPEQELPNFDDIWVSRLGAQWTAYRDREKGLVVRGGYAYVPSPAPEQSGRQSLLDNARNIITAGIGAYFPGTSAPIHLDLWGQAHFLRARRHTKDLSIYMPGEQVPFFTTRATGHILVGGLTMGVDI